MLPNPSCFEVTKRSPRPYRSLAGVAGLNAARGTAFIEHQANPGFAKLADGTVPITGFITRNAQVGGPTIADAIMPNRIELTFADTDSGATFRAKSQVICIEEDWRMMAAWMILTQF